MTVTSHSAKLTAPPGRPHWSYLLMQSRAYSRLSAFLRRRGWLSVGLLLGVPVLWVVVWNVLPLIQMANISFMRLYPLPAGQGPVYTLDNYRQIATDYTIYRPLIRTLVLSMLIVAATFVVMLPLAYFIAKKVPPGWQVRLLLLVMIPAWAGEIIRVFSYVLIFAANGAVNIVLQTLGLTERPIPFLYTWFSLSLGLLYVTALFMLLPLYAAIEKVPNHVLEAAADLGASPMRRFFRVTLPLIRDGIATGVTLVFLISTGIYTVPLILAGPGTNLFSQVIASYFYDANLTWPMGAAGSITLFVLALAIAAALNVAIRARRPK